ncbi:MAG: hypothetical protein QM817_35040 [Archangium sp.]
MDSYVTILSAQDDVLLTDIALRFDPAVAEPKDVKHQLIISAMDAADPLAAVLRWRCQLAGGGLARVDFVGHAVLGSKNGYGMHASNTGPVVLGVYNDKACGLELIDALQYAYPRADLVVRFILCDGHEFPAPFLADCLTRLRAFAPQATLLYTPEGVQLPEFGAAGFSADNRLHVVSDGGATMRVA